MKLRFTERRRGYIAPCAGLLVLCSGLLFSYIGPPYGIDAAEPSSPYLNGAFPPGAPTLPEDPIGWKTRDVFPNLSFSDILAIVAVPNSHRLSAADRYGKIWVFENRPEVASKQLFADLTDRVVVPRDGGFMGVAFHPEYGRSGSVNARYLYASYTAAGNTMRLSRFTARSDGLSLDPESELIMIESSHAGGQTHFGGSLIFGNDGFLYAPFGDAEVRTLDAQSISDNLIGGILRIDVDPDAARSHPPRRRLPKTDPDEVSGRGYWIPNDNPFLDTAGSIFEEYYSIGHRNPWKLALDRLTGRIWISELGHLKRDEFNVLVAGGNYGWYMREGSVEADPLDAAEPVPLPEMLGTLQDPVFDDRFGVVSGGIVYRGKDHPSLDGAFLGYANGIVALTLDNAGKKAAPATLVAPNAVGFVWAFGTDHQGEVLFIEGGRNKRMKTIAPIYGNRPDVPALLSETGAFADLITMEPAPGLIPFELNAPSWNNGALSTRWIAIPNDGAHDASNERIEFSEHDPWRYPAGTVAVQHLELPVDEAAPGVTRRLETRFLVLGESGASYGSTYRWRPDGSDAELISDEQFETVPIQTSSGTRLHTWHFPGPAQCSTCHTTAGGVFLGPRTHQLNGPFYYPDTGVTANQLESWNYIDLFQQQLDFPAASRFPAAAGIDDVTARLELRARSYLDVNCGFCHRPGNLTASSFDARFSVPLDQAGLINNPASESFGASNAVIVAPGDTSRSLLYTRMRSLSAPLAMPPIGKTHVDSAGAKLIANWILSLGGRLESFSPNRALPGEEIVLRGARFDEVTAVFFNGAGCEFTMLSPSLITAIVPDTATTGPIAVETRAGKFYSATDFEVLDARQTGTPSPSRYQDRRAQLDAYPMPMTQSLTIDFQLEQAERVRLDLFDVRGRHLRTLFDESRGPGSYRSLLNADDLASGTYYLRLETGRQVSTKTIVRVRE